MLPPFPFSFSFFPLRSSKLTLEHRTTSSTANYFLVIFHRATSTTRATRCLIIAAKMILSMGLPSPPPGPATGQTCDYNANAEYAVPPWNHSIEEGERRRKREGERRERRNRFSWNCWRLSAFLHVKPPSSGEFELHALESWNNRKRKSRVLACYPGRRHCKLKAGASLRNNGGGGFGGKLEIRRSRISREREKGGEGSMDG